MYNIYNYLYTLLLLGRTLVAYFDFGVVLLSWRYAYNVGPGKDASAGRQRLQVRKNVAATVFDI